MVGNLKFRPYRSTNKTSLLLLLA